MNTLNSSQEEIVARLVAEGTRRLNIFPQKADLPNIPDNRDPLDDFKNFPHLFVFGCVMDRQIKTEKVWPIPYQIGDIIGGLEFERFLKLSLAELTEIFNTKKLHRFNNDMAKCFYHATQFIHSKYNDHAENIWSSNPKSATVIRRFLEFNGVGIKIANMATNILTRDFKVLMQERSSIDIAPDVQVMKYFKNHGLLRPEASNEELIYRARELYPEFPGILDIAAWEGGRGI
jgi:endonuclease-3